MSQFKFATREQYELELIAIRKMLNERKLAKKRRATLEEEYEKLVDEFVKFCDSEDD